MNDIFYATDTYSLTYCFCYCSDDRHAIGEMASLAP